MTGLESVYYVERAFVECLKRVANKKIGEMSSFFFFFFFFLQRIGLRTPCGGPRAAAAACRARSSSVWVESQESGSKTARVAKEKVETVRQWSNRRRIPASAHFLRSRSSYDDQTRHARALRAHAPAPRRASSHRVAFARDERVRAERRGSRNVRGTDANFGVTSEPRRVHVTCDVLGL